MNFKTTIVLLVLVAIGAALWWMTPPNVRSGDAESKPDTSAARPRNILDPKPDPNEITRVEIERTDAPRLVFERLPAEPTSPDAPPPPATWRMLEPVEADTEGYMVNSIVSTFLNLQAESVRDSTELKPADAGLDKPVATVTLIGKSDEQEKRYVFNVGRKAVMGTDTYVQLAGDGKIYSVRRDLRQETSKEADEYRAKSLSRVRVGEVRKLELVHDGRTYQFARNDSGDWIIESPVRAHAENQKVRDLLNQITRLRVAEFVEDAPASLDRFGLDQPYLKLTFTTQTEKLVAPQTQPGQEPATPQPVVETQTHTFLFGAHADMQSQNRFVKPESAPWIATLPAGEVDKLVPKLAELRDPRVARVRQEDVTRLEIQTGGQTAVLEKSADQWRGSGELAELEIEAVRDVLRAVEDLRAVEFIDDPATVPDAGVDQPRATLKLTASGSVEPVELRIGAPTASGQNAYVQVAGQSGLLVVREQQAQRLLVTPLALRSREIFNCQPSAIRSVTLERDGRRYVLQRGDSAGWELSEPPDAPADAVSARELSNDLARLRARKVVARDDFAAYGLDQPAITIRFTAEVPLPGPQPAPESQPADAQPAQTTEHTLLVSRRENVTYARADDAPYVFELDETVYRVLTQELIERKLFDFAAEDVQRIRVDSTGGTVEFARVDDGWEYVLDPTVALAKAKLDEFAGELAAMRAEQFIAYGPDEQALAAFADAPATLTLTLTEDRKVTLKLAQRRPGELPLRAGWVEKQRAFVLRQADVEKIMRGLEQYIAAPQEPAQAAPPRGVPQPVP